MPSQRDRAWKEYSDRFRTRVLPHLLSSRVSLLIAPGSKDGDGFELIQFATQIGMLLIENKPIILMGLRGDRLSPKLRAIADVVIEDADMTNEETQDRLAEAIRLVEGLRR